MEVMSGPQLQSGLLFPKFRVHCLCPAQATLVTSHFPWCQRVMTHTLHTLPHPVRWQAQDSLLVFGVSSLAIFLWCSSWGNC